MNEHPSKLGYTIQEFTAVSGVGRTKTYHYIKIGKLRARKAGRHTIILADDAATFLKSLPVMESA